MIISLRELLSFGLQRHVMTIHNAFLEWDMKYRQFTTINLPIPETIEFISSNFKISVKPIFTLLPII